MAPVELVSINRAAEPQGYPRRSQRRSVVVRDVGPSEFSSSVSPLPASQTTRRVRLICRRLRSGRRGLASGGGRGIFARVSRVLLRRPLLQAAAPGSLPGERGGPIDQPGGQQPLPGSRARTGGSPATSASGRWTGTTSPSASMSRSARTTRFSWQSLAAGQERERVPEPRVLPDPRLVPDPCVVPNSRVLPQRDGRPSSGPLTLLSAEHRSARCPPAPASMSSVRAGRPTDDRIPRTDGASDDRDRHPRRHLLHLPRRRCRSRTLQVLVARVRR